MATLFPFPDRPRLWGVAVSHYQVEGNDPCDWTDWESAGKTKGGACGEAVGSWERYEEDNLLALEAGANALRFSISWSRVEPVRGQFDEVALERYRRVVEHQVRNGIEPVVTLFHFTHPRWFHEETPWSSPASVDVFARFARKVAEALGPAVRMWTVLNEPLVFLLGGYLDGQIPPGVSNGRLMGKAFDHMLAAHAAAAAAIREVNPAAAIGIAHNMVGIAPERAWNPLHRFATKLASRLYNRGILEAFGTGRFSLNFPPDLKISIKRDELPGSLDFFGVNYYSRVHMRCPGKTRFPADFSYLDRTGRGMTDNGWEIVPESLPALLKEASSLGLPLVVTENGLADADDSHRSSFLVDHAAALRLAGGAEVVGYLHWSLVDNYEWLDGYGPKFGLYEVDRSTFARRPRASVETFRRLGRQFLAGAEAEAEEPSAQRA
jgi:beta-glucosidase